MNFVCFENSNLRSDILFVLVSKYKTRKLKARYSNVLFQIYVGSISFNDTLENSEASVIYFYRSNSASESIKIVMKTKLF